MYIRGPGNFEVTVCGSFPSSLVSYFIYFW